MELSTPWRYVGYDESMNYVSQGGQFKTTFPHVFVAVSSQFYQDRELVRPPRPNYRKQHRNHRNVQPLLRKREHTYLWIPQSGQFGIPLGGKKLGVILGSLMKGKPVEDELDVYLDGEWGRGPLAFARYAVSIATGLDERRIHLHERKKHDKRRKLVNIADEAAHWLLYRRYPNDFDIDSDPHRVDLDVRSFIDRAHFFRIPARYSRLREAVA